MPLYIPPVRLLSLLGLCAILFACSDEDAEAAPSGPPPARVTTGSVREGAVSVRWTFFGQARPMEAATLAAGAEGEVRQVRVRVGDHVERGDRLVDIDPSVVQARLAAAQRQSESAGLQVEQARRDAERFSMAGTDAISAAEIEQAQARASVLESDAQRADASAREIRASLARHRLDAPFSGVVGSREVDPGDWVSPGTPMLTLVAEEGIEILVDAHPEAGRRLNVGDTATLKRGDATLEARVVGVVRALDPATRTTRIRLEPVEPPSWLVPGITVDVIFEVEQRAEGAFVVSRDALVDGAAGTRRVVRAAEGAARLVGVELVADGGEEVLVRALEGQTLSVGDDVVVRGNERLREGQPLQILSSQRAESPEASPSPSDG